MPVPPEVVHPLTNEVACERDIVDGRFKDETNTLWALYVNGELIDTNESFVELKKAHPEYESTGYFTQPNMVLRPAWDTQEPPWPNTHNEEVLV